MSDNTAVQTAKEQATPKIVKHETLSERMDAIFQDVARRAYQIFEGNGRQDGHDMEDWLAAEREMLFPADLTLKETDQAVEVTANVPGFTEKELEISVEPQRLTITGKHQANKEEKKGEAQYSESFASDLLQVVSLPSEVEADKAKAILKGTSLNITIPKAAQSQATGAQPRAAAD